MHLKSKFSGIFYGWWIVGACFVIALYTSGVVFYGFTAIFEPIADEFGWSYVQISIAASLRGLEMGLVAPLVGILVDRWGPRKLIFGGMLFVGLGLLLFSRTTSLGMFYIATIFMAIGMSTSGVTVTMTAVAHWFRRRVGLATGIMVCGYGASGLLVPVMVRLIDIYEWRVAVFILALGVFVITLPLSLLVRHRPEQYGYLPDGEASSMVIPEEDMVTVRTSKAGIGLKQALKSRTFCYLIMALMPQFIAVVAVVTHVMPYLSSLGIPRSMSGLVATAIPLLSVVGRLGFGWLGDKFSRRWLAAGALTMLALGLLCFELTSMGWTWLLVPFLIFSGVGYGGNIPIIGILVRDHFGTGSFGAIIGFMWGILMLGNMIGAPVAGWVFDYWGSYQGIWLAFAGLTVIGVIIMVLTPPVRTGPQASNRT